MDKSIIIKGHLTGPTSVELERPVTAMSEEVEVVLRPLDPKRQDDQESLETFLRNLPPGTRSKEDIDAQIREERESWGER